MLLLGAKTFLSKDIIAKQELKKFKIVENVYLSEDILKQIASPHVLGKYFIENVIFTHTVSLEAAADRDLILKNCFFEKGIYNMG